MGVKLFAGLLFACAFVITQSFSCQTPASQISALKNIYNSTNGAFWINRLGWGSGDPCNATGSWNGVICLNCNVTGLFLPNNNLTGTIPSSISSLTALSELNLSTNNLYGTIPASVGNLTNLLTIQLSKNSINGSIPNFANLKNLLNLYLEQNKLNGAIPSNLNITGLLYLYLQNNQLTGTLPPFLQKGFKGFFNAMYNQFNCPLPAWCSPQPVGNGECGPTCVNSTNIYSIPVI